MKRIFSLLMVFIMVFVASTIPGGAESMHCNCQDAENEQSENVRIMGANEIRKVIGQANASSDYREVKKWINKNNLKLVSNEAIGLENKDTGLQMISLYAVPKQNKENDLAFITFTYDPKKKSITNMIAQTFYSVHEEEFEQVEVYLMDQGFSDKMSETEYRKFLDEFNTNQNEGEFRTANSYCGYGSIFVCAYHCTVWGAATGGVGAFICSVACGLTWHWACNNF